MFIRQFDRQLENTLEDGSLYPRVLVQISKRLNRSLATDWHVSGQTGERMDRRTHPRLKNSCNSRLKRQRLEGGAGEAVKADEIQLEALMMRPEIALMIFSKMDWRTLKNVWIVDRK